MEAIRTFLKALRLPFLTGSLMPVGMAAALALRDVDVDLWHFILVMAGAGSLHLGANVINDVYDAPGSDPRNIYVTPFSGGSRVIQEGGISVEAMRVIAYSFFGLALMCGVILTPSRPLVLLVGALGLLGGYLYSADPVGFMNRGLGEVVIFLVFGPLLTWGAYYVFTGELNLTGFAVGLPLAFPITGVIWINQFPDYKADSEAEKRNLVVQMGTAKARYIHPVLMYGSFLAVLYLVAGHGATGWLVLTLAAFPLAHRAVKVCLEHHDDPVKIVAAQEATIKFHFALGLISTLVMAVRYWPR